MFRKLTVTRLIALFAFTLLLQGCVIAVNTDDFEDESWFSKQTHNAEVIENLGLGASETEIRDELGEPNFTESFKREGYTYRILFYRTSHHAHDGVTTRDETTPLVFVDGELVGWGDSAIEHATAGRGEVI